MFNDVFRRLHICCVQLALVICVAGLCAAPAVAQSTWEKMKLQFLTQACKGGDQNSCQQLAKLKQKLGQQGQAPQAQPQGAPQAPETVQPGQGLSRPAETAAAAPGAPHQAAEPWTPPGDDAAGGEVKLDPSKMPDIVGVRLGMTAQEALATARKTYPRDMYQGKPATWWPSTEKPAYGYNLLSSEDANQTDMVLSFTAPPGLQIVWAFGRQTRRLHIAKATLVAALREKYGKETAGWAGGDPRNKVDDIHLTDLLWLYDEHGARVPIPPSTTFTSTGAISDCGIAGGLSEPVMPKDDDYARNMNQWCAHHFVYLHIMMGGTDIVEYTVANMQDIPLAVRSSHAAAAWLLDAAKRQHQDDLEKAKEKKPVL